MLKKTLMTALLLVGIFVHPTPVSPALAGTPPRAASQILPQSYDASAFRCTNLFWDWLRPHPTQTGQACFGDSGWGRLEYRDAPTQRTVAVPFTTPAYTTSSSLEYICQAEELFARPVSPRSEGSIPDTYRKNDRVMRSGCDPETGLQDPARVGSSRVLLPPNSPTVLDNICVLLDPTTGTVKARYNNPCYHFNKWLYGPKNSISVCDFRKNCETIGHRPQKGYQRFLAHYELWIDTNVVVEPVGPTFRPCGAACDYQPPICDPNVDTDCVPCEEGDPDCPDTGCIPGSDPECTPCEPGDPLCTPCDPATDPGCLPVCEDSDDVGCTPPPPPPFCDTNPTDARCAPPLPAGVRFEVTVSIPDRFSAKGTLRSEGATVTAIELRCGDRPCVASAENSDPVAAGVNGNLVLDASGSFRRCTSPRSSGCGFYQDLYDNSAALVIGDRVTANFFSPTRATESVIVHVEQLVGRVRQYAMVPSYELRRYACAPSSPGCGFDGFRYGWVLSGRLERREIGTVEVPVVLRDQNAVAMPAGGFRRTVIGTVGD
jgi:hypothetical protein